MVKQVIIVRKDLNMSMGKAIAQGCHACENAVQITQNCVLEDWYDSGSTKIVLGVKNLAALERIIKKAAEANLPRALITDAGRTEFSEPTVTCGAIGPAPAEEIDKITKRLQLL